MILMNQTFTATMPTQIFFGLKVVKNQLSEELKNSGINNVLIVTDAGLMGTGLVESISANLSESALQVTIYSEVEPNPTAPTVAKGAELFVGHSCQAIIAIGGGSAMDAAKAIAVAAVNPGDILDYRRGGKIVQGPLPMLVAIPTTAGTGSEVTAVSVITDPVKNRKFVIPSPMIAPKMAFIDPEMTFTLPRTHIAATGMDALVHAIESYVSNRSHPIGDAMALQAIRMLREFLPASFADPTNIEAKAQVLLASTMAGYAFALSGLGMVHSMSHPMSAWFHVPHGVANAVLLPYVVEYNLLAKIDRYAEISCIFDDEARTVSKYMAAEKLVGYLKQFSSQLDIPEHFGYLQVNIDEQMIDRLAEDALDDRGTLPSNPRQPSKADIIALYKRVLPQYQASVDKE